MIRKSILILCLPVIIAVTLCTGRHESKVIVFHAGSLAVPMSRLAAAYEADNPGVRIITEAAGSLVSARKITELRKPCDIMASADYVIIDELLIPEFADWNLGFATNEIVIAYKNSSRFSDETDSLNWYEILLRKDVFFGRSDPDSDPCGYRTLMMLQLAEKYYGIPGLKESFENKDRSFIRPKEIDLTAMLEAGAIDYVFQYRSVAVQHGLDFIELPAEINLGDTDFSENYNSVYQEVIGSRPGETLTMKGDFIMYGITILRDAPNSEEAERFLAFIAGSRGRDILRETGQNPISPPLITGRKPLPSSVINAINSN
ncbi:MAG: tungstate ABC transporter substrate-binding protein WtpA [Bacteroidales bacterium]